LRANLPGTSRESTSPCWSNSVRMVSDFLEVALKVSQMGSTGSIIRSSGRSGSVDRRGTEYDAAIRRSIDRSILARG
jgi:hypothetical protein